MSEHSDPSTQAQQPGLPSGHSPEPAAQNSNAQGTSATQRFATLHERTIAVRLLAQGRYQWLHGVGAYEADPHLGGVLRVAIADKLSPYELLFIEGQWAGAISPGAAFGCDYLLSVG
jgi:hypothetical protein